MHPPACVQLPLVQAGLASAAGHPQDRRRTERVQIGDEERGLEVARGIVHLLGDRTGPQHLPQGVDGPVTHHDPPVRIDLADFLELEGAEATVDSITVHHLSPSSGPTRCIASRWITSSHDCVGSP
jgi:hypothetical protein